MLKNVKLSIMTNWKEYGVSFENFTEEITKEWIDHGFDKKETRDWLESGLQPDDVGFAQWIKVIKEKNIEWFSNHNKEELKKEYEEFSTGVSAGSKLSAEVIRQIKGITYATSDNEQNYYKHYSELGSRHQSLIDDLIPDDELWERYKGYGLCSECWQPKINNVWCKHCIFKHLQQDFDKWTSGNFEIDEFIQKWQLKASYGGKILEWIPYEQFTDIEYLAEGGFGKVYKAKWPKGSINSWNFEKGEWKRGGLLSVLAEETVALKILNNSRGTTRFLQEINNHKLVDEFNIVPCYGISQDLATQNHIMVMEYIEGGNLREFQKANYLNFESKFYQLGSIADGLSQIHSKGLVHRDFHAGNILTTQGNYCRVADLGLCRPANETNDKKIFGVLPYIAPEVLQGQPYTQTSDIYSFGMVAYEVMEGKPPYYEFAHDKFLAVKICRGLRPDLDNVIAPQLLKDLIKRCWDERPENRPTASEIYEIKQKWSNEYLNYTGPSSNWRTTEMSQKSIEFSAQNKFVQQYKKIDELEKEESRKLLSKLYEKFKGEYREIKMKEFPEIKTELFSEFCEKHGYKREEDNEKAWRAFDKLLYSGTFHYQIHSQAFYASRFIDTKQIAELVKKYQEDEQISSNQTKIPEQIKEIENKLEEFKKSLDNETELVDRFIESKKLSLKDKENKELEDRVWELEDKLEAKGLTTKMDEITRYCEELVELDKQSEKEQLETKIEVVPK